MENLTARDVMTTDVLVAQADWSLRRLAAFFTEHAISGAPVVTEKGALLGVVSSSDLVRWGSRGEGFGSPAEASREASGEPVHAYYLSDVERLRAAPLAAEAERAQQACVRDVMMPALFCVEEDELVSVVADKMLRGRLHRLLVTRKGQARSVVGLVTALDLLRLVRDEAPSGRAPVSAPSP